MKRRAKTLEIFSISALDLFASALGAFVLIAIMLFPYYKNLSQYKLPHTDLVIVLDTTGSMGGVTEALKTDISHLVEIMEEIAPSVAVGVVAFNDPEGEPPARTVFPLQEISDENWSLSELQSQVAALEAGAAKYNRHHGENLLGGAQLAVQSAWRDNAELKLIAIVTDDIPVQNTENGIFELLGYGGYDIIAIQALTGHDNESKARDFLTQLAKNTGGRYYETQSSLTAPILLGALSKAN